MKVLVISDSHGRNDDVKKVIEQVGEVDMMIHLGDIERGDDYIRSIAKCPPEQVYLVKGNNDYNLTLPYQHVIDIGGYRTLLTHGHRFYVNAGTGYLREYAFNNNIDVVMFGHTHMPYIDIGEDVTILNPGSLSYPRQEGRKNTFLVMEVDQEGNAHYNHGFLRPTMEDIYGEIFR